MASSKYISEMHQILYKSALCLRYPPPCLPHAEPDNHKSSQTQNANALRHLSNEPRNLRAVAAILNREEEDKRSEATLTRRLRRNHGYGGMVTR